jgi:hypothetical protein
VASVFHLTWFYELFSNKPPRLGFGLTGELGVWYSEKLGNKGFSSAWRRFCSSLPRKEVFGRAFVVRGTMSKPDSGQTLQNWQDHHIIPELISRKRKNAMKRNTRSRSALLACLLSIGLTSMVLAEEQSGCVTCHLDKAMLSKNLSGAKSKTSAMQSGSG